MTIKDLAVILNVHPHRDPCNDPVINGRRGNIHQDGEGFSIFVSLKTIRQWTEIKKKLLFFCTLRQEGDTEGVVKLLGHPTPVQANTLRDCLQIRQNPYLTDKQRERLRQNPPPRKG